MVATRNKATFDEMISKEALLIQNPATKHLRMIVPRGDGRSDVYSFNFEEKVFEYNATLPRRADEQ